MKKQITNALQYDFAILKTKFSLLDLTGYYYSIAYFNKRLNMCFVDMELDEALKIIEDYNLKEVHRTEDGVIYEQESRPFKVVDFLIKEKRKTEDHLKEKNSIGVI